MPKSSVKKVKGRSVVAKEAPKNDITKKRYESFQAPKMPDKTDHKKIDMKKIFETTDKKKSRRSSY
jgi:hypothetical protein